MGTSLFIVIESLNRWWIDYEGRPYGPFASQRAAAESGVEIARSIGCDDCEVLVRDAEGFFRVFWDCRNEHIRTGHPAGLPRAAENRVPAFG